MSFIYCITNDVNGKQYVGKTNRTIEKRFKEHCRDSQNEKCKNRPLYRAMNKYGIEHFHFEQLEECSSDESSKRESFWINKLNTFCNGYNATTGGDGCVSLDYNKILALYNNTKMNAKEISNETNCNPSSVRKVIRQYKGNGWWKNRNKTYQGNKNKHGRYRNSRPVIGIKKKNGIICYFPSLTSACSFIGGNSKVSHINEACNGKRHSAYDFYWCYSGSKTILEKNENKFERN